MADNYDILELVDQIPYQERASGSDTTQKLARLLADSLAKKQNLSKTFQAQAKEANKNMFNPQMPPPIEQQPAIMKEPVQPITAGSDSATAPGGADPETNQSASPIDLETL